VTDTPDEAPPEASGIKNAWTNLLADENLRPLSPRRAELHRLADAARVVIRKLVSTDAPIEVLAAAADDLEAVAGRFEGYHSGSLYEGFAESANAGGDSSPMFDHSPILGKGNPIAPPLALDIVDGVVHGRVHFTGQYEGPPGCVHGGYIAATFDELLGSTQSLSGQPGMTGTLTIRYENPTPLHTDLRLEGELEGVEGRKVFTVGRLYAGDTVTAIAHGTFISIGMEGFKALKDIREQSPNPPQP
jgi:acyl-coenzyme A thioesterase PaaI-like protein